MSKAEGIYLSSDYRVTDARSGKTIDDASVKFLTVYYPPDKSGPKALIAYTGLAILPEGTPMGTWIRETLRGESEFFDKSMEHLGARLNRDIAQLKISLMVNALVVHGDRRYFGGFTNLKSKSDGKPEVQGSFGYVMQELKEPFLFANGSGAAGFIADAKIELVRSQLQVTPRKPLDHMRLLAEVNRRVAAADKSVSPFCQVSFVNANDRMSPTSHIFVEKGEAVPFEMPILLFGIDLSYVARQLHEGALSGMKGEPPPDDLDADAINKELRRRP
jgi:hypothetical protein